jgi:hypothetical protein
VRDYPSVDEIRGLAEELVEIATRIRGRKELRFAPEGGHEAGATPPGDLSGGEKYAVGPDGRYRGTAEDWSMVRAGYQWIPEMFVANVGPEPSGFNSLIDDMDSARKALYDSDSGVDPIGSEIANVQQHLSDWTGTAAETFRYRFLNRIPDAARNQAHIALMLREAMVADQDIYVEVRRNLKDLALTGRTALESITKCGGTDEVIMVLSVIAVVGSIATLAGAPAVWTVVVGLASAGALTAQATRDDPIETDLAADTVDGVLRNVIDAITQLQHDLYWSERKITDALNDNLHQMTDGTHRYGETSTRDAFLPPRPALVGLSMIPVIIERDFQPT